MRRFVLLVLAVALACGLALLFQSMSTSTEPRRVENIPTQVREPATIEPETELSVPRAAEVSQLKAPVAEVSAAETSDPKPAPVKEPAELKRVRFRARVTGPDFLAKARAVLEFRIPGQEEATPTYGEKLTDDYGVYVEERSFGEVEVRALPPRWEPALGPSHWRFVKVTGQEELDIGDLVLTFPNGTAATGRVLDSEGQPVADVEVVLHRREDKKREVATWTDEKGRYSFTGLEFGRYRIGLTKGAFEESSDRCFLSRRPVLPWFGVHSASGSLIELADTELRLGGARHHFYFHPPPDALVSTVKALVQKGQTDGKRAGWIPLEVDQHGIAEWHPKKVAGHSATHRIDVIFRRSTGEDIFSTKVEVVTGKTSRYQVP